MIEFRTLGGLDLHDSQGRELRAIFSAPKRAALLTYLAIATPRGFHRRDTLLALFWPELDHEHARRALRQALYKIRRSVTDGSMVSPGDEEVGLDRDAFWCDAVAFEQLLDDGRLEEALALYRGELLEGFHLSGCLEFERWLEDERRRLKDRAAEAAWSLAEQAVAEGRTAQAARWGRRALAFSPSDEGVLQRVIELLDRAGDRAGAIRGYEAFAKRLREDYEAEPAPETTALIASVRAREQANGAVQPSAPVTQQAAAAPVANVTVEARRSWRTRRLAVGALVALGAVAVAGATVIANGRGDAPALDPTRVLVDIFRNKTGDPSLDHLGRMATDRVTAGLTMTSFVDVVSLGTRLLSREPVVPDTGLLEQADLQALARANGTGTVVSGSYYLQGDSVHFLARVTNADNGEELATIEPVRASVDAAVDAVEQLRDRVMTTLATLTDPRLAKWMRYASQPPTFEAYTEFVEGIELATHRRHREALPHFLAAVALDSNFTMASLWAAWEYENTGQAARRDSIDDAFNRRRVHLAPLDRLWLDYQLAYGRDDHRGALKAMRRFVQIAPGSEFLYKAGQAAFRADRPREAIEFLTQADPESGWLRGWDFYWDILSRSYHMLGEHREELAVARRARRLFPNSVRRELLALAALGRTDAVQALIGEVPAQSEEQTIQAAHNAASELFVHGHVDAASQVLDRGIMLGQAWLSTLPTDTTSGQIGGVIWQLAEMLVLRGRVDEARVLLERALEEERAGNPFFRREYIGTLGLIAGMQGDRQRALEIGQDLAAQPWRSPSELVLWHARIAASLGEIDQATALVREAVGKGLIVRSVHQDAPLLWRALRDHPPFQELIRPKG